MLPSIFRLVYRTACSELTCLDVLDVLCQCKHVKTTWTLSAWCKACKAANCKARWHILKQHPCTMGRGRDSISVLDMTRTQKTGKDGTCLARQSAAQGMQGGRSIRAIATHPLCTLAVSALSCQNKHLYASLVS